MQGNYVILIFASSQLVNLTAKIKSVAHPCIDFNVRIPAKPPSPVNLELGLRGGEYETFRHLIIVSRQQISPVSPYRTISSSINGRQCIASLVTLTMPLTRPWSTGLHETNERELSAVHRVTPFHLHHQNVSRSSSLVSGFDDIDYSSQNCEVHIHENASESNHQFSILEGRIPCWPSLSGSSSSETGHGLPDGLKEQLMVYFYFHAL